MDLTPVGAWTVPRTISHAKRFHTESKYVQIEARW